MHKCMLLLFSGVLLFSFSCRDEKDTPSLNSDKELISFSFSKVLNQTAHLEQNITAFVDSTEIVVYLSDSVDRKALIASFQFKGLGVFVDSKEQHSGITPNDFREPITYVVRAKDGSEREYHVKVMTSSDATGYGIPHVYIYTNGKRAILSKEDYVHGFMVVDGNGDFDDYQGTMKIKGRGNTSWKFPKKPYKIKLEDKASLFGLAAHKEWILLANWRIGNLLGNAIPYKMAQLLGMPFANHMVPVVVTLNGRFMGFYDFTEQKEVGEGRIDIGEDGVLLEMDYEMDEDWQFRTTSDLYGLPVMIQNPEIGDSSGFKRVRDDFIDLLKLIKSPDFPDNNYLDYFDDVAFANYMLVYLFTDNEEINHLKSTYMNKKSGGKYKMGIIWDFDSGFGFVGHRTHFKINTAATPLFWSGGRAAWGTFFFERLMADPHLIALIKDRWKWFKANKYQALRDHVIQYAGQTKKVFVQEHRIWENRGSSGDRQKDLQEVLNWMDARVKYLDDYIAGL